MAAKASTTTYFMETIIPPASETFARSLRDWRFWCIAVAAIAAMAATAALGRWQLARAAQKLQWQATIDARQAEPPVPPQAWGALVDSAAAGEAASSVQGPGEAGAASPLLHRRTVLRGRWLAAHTVFLDNRQMQGRPGFFVLTPLQLAPGASGAQGPVVLVQRGWVPRNFQDRARVPEIPAPPGEVEVRGRIAAPPSRLYEPGGTAAPVAGEGSSPIRQNLDLAAYRAETGLARLAPLTVLETGPAEGALLRDWPAIDTGVAKHYAYAFQWFGLCALVAILYVWFQIVRRFLRPRRQPAA
ncbi:SURF1-like protein [Paracidovorax anthurii]|uniref:SURF1-like protein n=2 Tax=Paracidovorax anthurii TaxID=78229 RepID=A0A328Z2L6_9BURK|nr:surfeit locus 1 family protein [Paracidovorax anthurii]